MFDETMSEFVSFGGSEYLFEVDDTIPNIDHRTLGLSGP